MKSSNKEIKFEKIFKESYSKIKTFSIQLLKSEEEAEDIAQEVFVRLWNMPELWIDSEEWRAYTFTMTRNMIYDVVRHKLVETKYQSEFDALSIQYTDDINEHLYAREIQLLVNLTLSRMPEKRRRIFLLSRQKGFSNKEIAEIMSISVRTVEHHLYLALSELKKVVHLMIVLYSMLGKC